MGVNDRKNIWDEVRRIMRLVNDEMKKMPVAIDLVEVARPRSVKANTMSALLKGMGDDDEEEEGAEIAADNLVIGIELERYKLMKSLPVQYLDETFSNALSWWQMQEKILPVLSTVARRVLCVPATSAPSERVFSVAGWTISKFCTSVQPQHASELIFLHDSWPLAEICEKEFGKNE